MLFDPLRRPADSCAEALSRDLLAAVYRRAAVTLLTSSAEGFGLPLIESLACGCPVVAADLPVFREIGGTTITYCTGADANEWADVIMRILRERIEIGDLWARKRAEGIAHAAGYSWIEAARRTVAVYRKLLGTPSLAK